MAKIPVKWPNDGIHPRVYTHGYTHTGIHIRVYTHGYTPTGTLTRAPTPVHRDPCILTRSPVHPDPCTLTPCILTRVHWPVYIDPCILTRASWPVHPDPCILTREPETREPETREKPRHGAYGTVGTHTVACTRLVATPWARAPARAHRCHDRAWPHHRSKMLTRLDYELEFNLYGYPGNPLKPVVK